MLLGRVGLELQELSQDLVYQLVGLEAGIVEDFEDSVSGGLMTRI